MTERQPGEDDDELVSVTLVVPCMCCGVEVEPSDRARELLALFRTDLMRRRKSGIATGEATLCRDCIRSRRPGARDPRLRLCLSCDRVHREAEALTRNDYDALRLWMQEIQRHGRASPDLHRDVLAGPYGAQAMELYTNWQRHRKDGGRSAEEDMR